MLLDDQIGGTTTIMFLRSGREKSATASKEIVPRGDRVGVAVVARIGTGTLVRTVEIKPETIIIASTDTAIGDATMGTTGVGRDADCRYIYALHHTIYQCSQYLGRGQVRIVINVPQLFLQR